MNTEDKKQKIKELLAEIPRSSSFASVSLTTEIAKLSEEIEQEKMEAKKQAASQDPTKIPD